MDFEFVLGYFSVELGEESSLFFNLISKANNDHIIDSGASTVALLHDVEHAPIKDNLHGPLILLPKSVHGYSDVEQELEKGGSLKNIISLANWNEGSDESDEACSLVINIQPLMHGIPASGFPFNEVSSSK